MMRRAWAVLVWMLVAGLPCQAEDAMKTFAQANAVYEQGHFAEAIPLYEQVLAAGLRDGRVYYNLGNAWYQSGNLGQALLNYQRARQLMPRDANIAFNLREVEGQRVDIVDQASGQLPASVQVLLALHHGTNLNESIILMVALGWLLAIWLALAVWGHPHMSPVLWRWVAGILVVLLLAQGASMGAKIYERYYSGQAVTLEEGVSVTTSPGGGTERLVINSGTYATIEAEHGDFVQIRLANGVIGFAPRAAFELVWPPAP